MKKKIKKKKTFSKKITREKNIRIRERNEHVWERYANTLFIVLISGALFGTLKHKYTLILGIILIAGIYALYMFIENKFLTQYREYTNDLIRKQKK